MIYLWFHGDIFDTGILAFEYVTLRDKVSIIYKD